MIYIFALLMLCSVACNASRPGSRELCEQFAQQPPLLSSTALMSLIESSNVSLPTADIWKEIIIPYLGNMDEGPMQELSKLGKTEKNLNIIRTTSWGPQSTHLNRAINSVLFSHNESKILATTKAECVVWDIATEKQIFLKSFIANESEPLFSADDLFVLRPSNNNEYDKWNSATGKYLGTIAIQEFSRPTKESTSLLTTQQHGSNVWTYTDAEQLTFNEKVMAPLNCPGRVLTTLFNPSQSIALTHNKKNHSLYDKLSKKNLLHMINAPRGAHVVFQTGFIHPTLNQWLILMMFHDKKKSLRWWSDKHITFQSLVDKYKISPRVIQQTFATFDAKDQALARMHYNITDEILAQRNK